MFKEWVIFGYVDPTDNQPLFWNDDDGWVSLESASVFSNEEKESMPNLWLVLNRTVDEEGSLQERSLQRKASWVGLPVVKGPLDWAPE